MGGRLCRAQRCAPQKPCSDTTQSKLCTCWVGGGPRTTSSRPLRAQKGFVSQVLSPVICPLGTRSWSLSTTDAVARDRSLPLILFPSVTKFPRVLWRPAGTTPPCAHVLWTASSSGLCPSVSHTLVGDPPSPASPHRPQFLMESGEPGVGGNCAYSAWHTGAWITHHGNGVRSRGFDALGLRGDGLHTPSLGPPGSNCPLSPGLIRRVSSALSQHPDP